MEINMKKYTVLYVDNVCSTLLTFHIPRYILHIYIYIYKNFPFIFKHISISYTVLALLNKNIKTDFKYCSKLCKLLPKFKR